MQVTDVSLWKKCPDDCGCVTIDGDPSVDSVMWTHENVDAEIHHKYDRGEVSECGYADLFLSCGTVVGYVDVKELAEQFDREVEPC